MLILTDPFFWAFVGMFGLLIGTVFVSGIKLSQNPLFGLLTVATCDFPRLLLVLPFCPQPRFEIGIWNWLGGGVFLLAALIFGLPALSIDWRRGPNPQTVLKTDGIYRIVRNPIYLADLLFTLGAAWMFGSILGLALLPVWWVGYELLVLVEEASLERALGEPYRDYKRRVKGRLIPGLPI